MANNLPNIILRLKDKLSNDNKLLQINENDLNFICVKKDCQGNISHVIRKLLKVDDDYKIIQVIGDCDLFSSNGTEYAYNFLKNCFKDKIIVEWGLTGRINTKLKQLDTNCLTGELIRELKLPYIANIVDHTIDAISMWKCQYLECAKQFVYVYDLEKTLFGSDIKVSDETCDMCIVLEGGAQSFAQVINCLSLDKNIVLLHGLRTDENRKYFSVAEFFYIIKQNNTMDIQKIYKDYIDNKLLINFKKGDAKTKKSLYDYAWKFFMDESIWTKLDNCKIYVYDN
jgi:hypothetical protein